MDHNPWLKKSAPGARGGVEQRENIEWQNRAEPPSEFENRLGDALEEIFGRGVDALPDLVAELNKARVLDRDGKPWTEDSFQAQLRRLGA